MSKANPVKNLLTGAEKNAFKGGGVINIYFGKTKIAPNMLLDKTVFDLRESKQQNIVLSS